MVLDYFAHSTLQQRLAGPLFPLQFVRSPCFPNCVDKRSISYDNTQHQYDVSRILTPEVTLDEAAYKAYSPLYLSTTFGFSYALSFGSLTAVLSHTLLFYYKDLFHKFRNASSTREDDIHARLYRKYPEVPDWWYYLLFAIMMMLSIVVCEAWDTRLPWWGFIVTQLIPFIFTLPIGIVMAITNVGIGMIASRVCRVDLGWQV
jgi:hypothetical protein